MTAEELRQYQAYKAEQEQRAWAQKRKDDREAYKVLSQELVERYIPELRALSEQMRTLKGRIYDDFASLIETKGDLYEVKQGQRSHSWCNAPRTMRLTLGYHSRDGWDDTVDSGIAIVKEHISSLASDEASGELVAIILDLLAKDGQGNLQADKILQLESYAIKSGNERFIEGVGIIKDAYRPDRTKQYIKAQVKGAQNEWITIPLGITEVGNVTSVNE